MKLLYRYLFFSILCLVVMGSQATQRRGSQQKVDKDDIFTLDHFIELVEKIERHPFVRDKEDIIGVANFLRKISFNDTLTTILLGDAEGLPAGILSLPELSTLTEMMKHGIGPHQEEMGVVVSESDDTLAIGYVILGICAGLRRSTNLILPLLPPDEREHVDNLYAITIAGSLARTALSNEVTQTSSLFGSSGRWFPNKDCPVDYILTNDNGGISNAKTFGLLDGFILGFKVHEWSAHGVRLGQLLRMYYGAGVSYDESFVSCNRFANFKNLVVPDVLAQQVSAFSFVYESLSRIKVIISEVKNTVRRRIPRIAVQAADNFHQHIDQLAQTSSCKRVMDDGCERPANVVFVMDESGSITAENYEKEKEFVRQIIQAFDISYLETRVAIVEFSTYAKVFVTLREFESKKRLLCALNGIHYQGGHTFTGEAIRFVQEKVLAPQQWWTGQQTSNDAVVQVVVVLTDGKSTDKNELEEAVRDIKEKIKDLTMIAIGIGNDYDREELELIASNPMKHVFTSSSFEKLLGLVASLRNRTCQTPGNLWFDFRDNGNETTVTAVVSPGKVRYFTLRSDMFIGLKEIRIQVTPLYGTVSIYASRTTETPGPSDYDLKIEPQGIGQPLILYLADPCEEFGNTTAACPPIYIAVYGHHSSLNCSDYDCNLPNQIKFTIQKGSLPTNSTGFRNSEASRWSPHVMFSFMSMLIGAMFSLKLY